MLLLVVNPKIDRGENLGWQRARTKSLAEREVNMISIAIDLGDRRSRECSPRRLLPVPTLTLVVAVEQSGERVVKARHLAGRIEHEVLKKTSGVSQVPLGWTDMGRGLNDVVFNRQRSTQPSSCLPTGLVALKQHGASIGDRGGPEVWDARDWRRSRKRCCLPSNVRRAQIEYS